MAKKSNSDKNLFARALVGMALIMFAMLSFMCLVVGDSIYPVGALVRKFLLGVFGYYSFIFLVLCVFGGLKLVVSTPLFSKKVSNCFAAANILLFVVFAIIHLAVSFGQTETLSERLQTAYNGIDGSGTFASATVGGAMFSLLLHPILLFASKLGTYIILSLAAVLAGLLLVKFIKPERIEKGADTLAYPSNSPQNLNNQINQLNTQPIVNQNSQQMPNVQNGMPINDQVNGVTGSILNQSNNNSTTSAIVDEINSVGNKAVTGLYVKNAIFETKNKKELKADINKQNDNSYAVPFGNSKINSNSSSILRSGAVSYAKQYEEDFQEKVKYVTTPPKADLSNLGRSPMGDSLNSRVNDANLRRTDNTILGERSRFSVNGEDSFDQNDRNVSNDSLFNNNGIQGGLRGGSINDRVGGLRNDSLRGGFSSDNNRGDSFSDNRGYENISRVDQSRSDNSNWYEPNKDKSSIEDKPNYVRKGYGYDDVGRSVENDVFSNSGSKNFNENDLDLNRNEQEVYDSEVDNSSENSENTGFSNSGFNSQNGYDNKNEVVDRFSRADFSSKKRLEEESGVIRPAAKNDKDIEDASKIRERVYNPLKNDSADLPQQSNIKPSSFSLNQNDDIEKRRAAAGYTMSGYSARPMGSDIQKPFSNGGSFNDVPNNSSNDENLNQTLNEDDDFSDNDIKTESDKLNNSNNGAFFNAQSNQTNVNAKSKQDNNTVEEKVEPNPIEIMPCDYQYVYPPIALLKDYGKDVATIRHDQEKQRNRAEKIVETLKQRNIPATVEDIIYGPTVTRFVISIPPSVSNKAVIAAKSDLQMWLEAAAPIRLLVPIPSTSKIGIEVPNAVPSMVGLKEVLNSNEFTELKPNGRYFALGEDIVGTPIFLDILDMPHLIVAGATNTGKSVCLNSMLLSLLYRYSPQDLRLIIVDPKMVEFEEYRGIPHLLFNDILSNDGRALAMLEWATVEMDRRFMLLKAKGARKLSEYNQRINPKTEKKLPYIIILVDEFSELMLTAQDKKKMENAVMRLAQKARAAGISLIFATQRPSADVIDGSIKNNFSSRICFKTSSYVDSQVVIGKNGAEELLGKGDVLFKTTTMQNVERAQGAFVSDEEISRVTEYVRSNNQSFYDEYALQLINKTWERTKVSEDDGSEETSGESSNDFDPVFLRALRLAIVRGKVTASSLQTWMSIGFPRASNIVNRMEEQGFISKNLGNNVREIYITKEDYENRFGEFTPTNK